ncbi:MAG: hypothetical protein V3S47_08825 [Acidobacteriota bacterium]
MRSITTRVVALFLVFVVGAAPGNAKEAPQARLESQGGGLQTATFDTFTGTVTVNLPEDIVAGDTFSGTVVAEPEGDSDKKKGKNLAALVGYVFEFGNQARGTVGNGRLKLEVPEARDGSAAPSTATLILREVRNGKPGREIGRVEIPVRATAPEIPDFRLPTLAQQNVPLLVSGPFDGDLNSSALSIGGIDALPLAESPRGAIFRSPRTVSGVVPITLHERGELAAEGKVRNIGTNLSAPKPNLAAGESTTLTTRVTGLEDLDEEIPLRLRFWPAAIISVQGGYDHEKTIRPEDVGPDGTYTFGVRITGRLPGSWGASVRVKVPEPSVIDHYVLVLDGAPMGEIEPEGKFEPQTGQKITFRAGLDLAQPFYDWMQASFTEGPQPRDGQIVGVDALGKSLEVSDFRQAHIESVRFPALDSGDKSPATMTFTIQPESVRSAKGDGKMIETSGPQTKQWLCSNFRIEIGDLPLDRVSKIDSLTWKQTIEPPGLMLTLSSADLSTWERWHRTFHIVRGERGRAPGGRLIFLGPERQGELATLEFHDVTYSSLTIDNDTASSTGARTVSIEWVGSRLSFKR